MMLTADTISGQKHPILSNAHSFNDDPCPWATMI